MNSPAAGITLEAKDIYILMKKEYRISRNIRAEWYLKRINSHITISRKTNVKDFHGELEVVSVLPKDPPLDWDSDTAHEFKYLVTEKTQLHFLARKYRIVFCLDLSPSLSVINLHHGKVIFDEVFPTLEKCLKRIVKPFYVPGSQLLFFPKIYITIIAHTPFFKSQPQQVLVQGWLLMNEKQNLHAFLKKVRLKLIHLQNQLAELTSGIYRQTDRMEANIEGTQEKNGSVGLDCLSVNEVQPIVSPDIGFVNMLRYGIVALQLLPENSTAGIIVITDGVISLPDATMFDALLIQLRNQTISCSFLQIGSPHQPHVWGLGLGFVPFNDLMEFLSNATFGAYLPQLPDVDKTEGFTNEMNDYHRAFLTWGFQKGFQYVNSKLCFYGSRSYLHALPLNSEASVIVRKQEWRAPLAATLNAVLSCRLREGYTIKQVNMGKEYIQLILVLPWKYSIAIEYHIQSSWPPIQNEVQTEVWIEASYEFLNDVSTKDVNTGIRSHYRQRMVAKYWQTLKDLKETDLLLVSLQSFLSSSVYFTIPEFVQKGSPVFYLSSQTGTPVPAGEFGAQSSTFSNFWLPVSMLNVNKWQKWMHTHRIGIILKHESPLPKHLHITNTSGRYDVVQCRHSEQILATFLAKWVDFTLIEANSYIKFLFKNEEDTSPSSFFVVRITSKRPPLLTIHLAFLGGTPGHTRNKMVNDLQEEILKLTLRVRERSRERRKHSADQKTSDKDEGGGANLNLPSAVPCCTITHKPIEKILIWHDRIPLDLFSSQVEDVSSRFDKFSYAKLSNLSVANHRALLCRYLNHRRWIWGLDSPSAPPISTNAIMKILNTITRMRLQEGFQFAYSCSGIVTLIREVKMKLDIHAQIGGLEKEFDHGDMTAYCVVQYIMFPPDFVSSRDSQSEDESVEADGESQVITECWMEPQNGIVEAENNPATASWQGLNYKDLSQSFFTVDRDCIWSLIAFECLSQFCLDDENCQSFSASSSSSDLGSKPHHSQSQQDPIQKIPFFLSISTLLPRCRWAEILFSSLFQDFYFALTNHNQTEDAEDDEANRIVFSLILDHLNELHKGKQFFLSHQDNVELPKVLAVRKREDAESQSPFSKVELDVSHPKVPKWRWYLKHVSQNHFLITLVPASYYDLKLLLGNKANIVESNPNAFRLLKRMEDLTFLDGEGATELELEGSLHPTASFSPLSHQLHLPGYSSTSSRSSSNSHTLLPSNYVGKKLASSTTSPLSDLTSSRARYKSGPALTNLDVGEIDDTIEPLVRERTRSLQSGREQLTMKPSGNWLSPVSNGSPSTGMVLMDKRDSLIGQGLPEKERRRNMSMPSKAHKEALVDYPNKVTVMKSVSVELVKGDQDLSIFGDPQKLFGRTILPVPARNHKPVFGSVILPIYVFDCRLNSIIKQLINRDPRDSVVGKDIFMDSTFLINEEVDGTDSREDSPGSSTAHEMSDKRPSPDLLSEESDVKAIDSKYLKNFADSIETCQRRSFVMGVFEALSCNIFVHECDVQAALDQCQEMLLETDITNYLQVICGHLKDFMLKRNYEQRKQRDPLKCQDVKLLDAEHDGKLDLSFPLYLLKDHEPSPDLVTVHKIIQQRFVDIISNQFKQVPGHPDFYYYCPSYSPVLNLYRRSSPTESYGAEGEDEEEEPVECEDEDRDKSIEFRADDGSCVNTRYLTQLSQFSQMSDFYDNGRRLSPSEEDGQEKRPIQPLFLHLTCTIRLGRHTLTSTSVSTIPTCLADVTNCLTNEELDLSKFTVTLDVLVMTLLSGATISSGLLKGTSMCEDPDKRLNSGSSVLSPQLQRASECTNNSASDNEELCFEGEKLLKELPPDQYTAVLETIDRIRWLVEDEIVSSKSHCYPVTENTLELVASHVAKYSTAANCILESVPLNFVFGTEQSMEKFMQEFRKMKIPGYQLEKEGNLYYLTMSQIGSRKRHSCLYPPLFFRSTNAMRTEMNQSTSQNGDDSSPLKTSVSSPYSPKSPTRKMLQKVSFETDMCTGTVETKKEGELVSKEKWIKRRERKERRDSIRGAQLESSDSEEELPVASVPPHISTVGERDSSEEPKCTSEDEKIVTSSLAELTLGRGFQNSSTPTAEGLLSYTPFPEEVSLNSVKRRLDFLDENSLLKTDSDLLGPKPCELIRSGSVNIPQSQVSRVEVIRKSASTEDFSPAVAGEASKDVSTRTPEDISKSRHSSGGDAFKSRHNSGTGSFFGGLQSDVSSLIESGQTTEDGCEGDISNSDDCTDWLQDFEKAEPMLPDFWLIIRISSDVVTSYFHHRHEVGLNCWKKVHKDVIQEITEQVKLVNQQLLLQDLHDNRECNILLEPEMPDDIWRVEDSKDAELETSVYLEAAMKFKLGAFACPLVWLKNFELHPRLKITGKVGTKGIQTLQAVLNHFSVKNRKNMFVYEDNSGIGTNVFYLRLHEQQSQSSVVVDPKKEESGLCRSSSVVSLAKRASKEEDFLVMPEPRSRVSSFVEKDVIMEGIPSTSTLKKSQDFIVLTVHGIAEPGSAIKENLVQMLQKRLDDAVLDAICLLLWNNRHHKLTPDDVHFIQPPYQNPRRVLRFSANSKALPYMQAASYYLRQNMKASGFTMPKYTDNRPENHFQDFSATDQDPSTESNIFLFIRSQKSGAKGIACIAYSVVDAAGNSFQYSDLRKLSPKRYEELSSEKDFDIVTETSQLNSPFCGSRPEEAAVFQFKIWESGRLDVEEVDKCLYDSIRHALWDLTMEYRFLVAPVTTSAVSSPISQPTTPTKVFRQLTCSKSIQGNIDGSTSPLLYNQKYPHVKISDGNSGKGWAQVFTKRRTSADNINRSGTARSPLKARYSFDYGNAQILSKVSDILKEEEMLPNMESTSSVIFPQFLHPLFSKYLTKWMEFGHRLNVPAVRKHTIVCPARCALPTFISELCKWIELHFPDANTKIFKSSNIDSSEYLQVDLSEIPEILKSLQQENGAPLVLITNRNEKHWYSTLYHPDIYAGSNINMRFESLLHNHPSSSESLTDSTGNVSFVSSPLVQQQTVSASMPGILKPVPSGGKAAECNFQSIVIHRQLFLLAILCGSELTVYSYNWTKETNESLHFFLNRLCQWISARTRLLSSLVLQKLGLFHDQPFVRKELNDKETNPFVQNMSYIKALIKCQAPNKDIMNISERAGKKGLGQSPLHDLFEVLRDSPPSKPLSACSHRLCKDLLQRHGMQMAEIVGLKIQREKERTVLQAVKKNLSASTAILSEQMLLIFKKHSRIIHFCLTPLLFLPKWRIQVAAARAHSFEAKSISDALLQVTLFESGAGRSGTSPGGGGPALGQTQRKVSGIGMEDKWHDALCLNYLKEFIQYLNCLGFVTLSVTSQQNYNPKSSRQNSKTSDQDVSSSESRGIQVPEQVLLQPTYLVKNFFGGVVALQINFLEPYFSATVYILEANRCPLKRIKYWQPSIKIPTNFIDEFEMIRVLLHMHSFTYDYHLRAVSVYVANRQLLFAHGYHLSSFLSDFIKYYNKGPNFARNLIHAGDICIENTGTPGEHLYNYLLAREKEYHMRVLRMTPTVIEPANEMYTEFVLVHTQSFKRDANDYEVTLLVSHDTTGSVAHFESNLYSLSLRFYVILTSRRDMYPTHNVEKKPGRFKTVSTATAFAHLRDPAVEGGSIGSPVGVSLFPTVDSITSSSQTIPNPESSDDCDAIKAVDSDVIKAVNKESLLQKQALFSISYEPVNYLGYYSEYEDFMQNILKQQVIEARHKILDIFNTAKIHCRRDFLWQRLIGGQREEEKVKNKEQLGSLNFSEFTELLTLVDEMPISKVDECLLPFLSKPIYWYQGLGRIVMGKYQDRSRVLTSPDGNVSHVLVFSCTSSDVCIMLSVDLHKSQANISLLRKHQNSEGVKRSALDHNTRVFLQDYINCCCFHLWSGLL